MEQTAEQRRDLIEKLRSHHDELAAIVGGLDAEVLLRAPAPGEWSPAQQLEHLLLTLGIWTSMASRAVSEDAPDLAELWNSLRRAEEPNPFPPPVDPRPAAEVLAELAARLDETVSMAESLPAEALFRVGRNTGFGDLTVLQMLRAVYRHYRMHIDQVRGREPSFTPRRPG
jgi:hypothetical protein